MEKTLNLSQALKLMSSFDEKGNPVKFNLAYRTFNSQSKKGGKLKMFNGAEMLQKSKETKSLNEFNVFDVVNNPKNPNHWKNRTRNIKVNGKVKKIVIDYIIALNGQKVNY